MCNTPRKYGYILERFESWAEDRTRVATSERDWKERARSAILVRCRPVAWCCGASHTAGSRASAKSAAERESASMGGSATRAMPAAERASASTGGNAASAKIVAEQASASTGDSVLSARIAAERASASMGGDAGGAKTAF